jgi:NitT/TauT family transport system ATP-binding protein
MSRPLHIQVDQARKSFYRGGVEIPVIGGVSLDIYQGEFLTLFGPNGCGKTTLLNTIVGIEPLDSGRITIQSKHAQGCPEMGFIFQDYRGNLMPWLTVAQNIGFPLKVRGVPERERKRRVEELQSRFGFSLDLNARTYALSCGQAQLTSILRALIIDPEILIMDEPFSALDYQTNLSLYEKVLLIWKTAGVTVLLISHDIDEALYLGERTVFLKRRPARIAEILENDLPGTKDLDQLGTEAFAALKRKALEIFRKEASED